MKKGKCNKKRRRQRGRSTENNKVLTRFTLESTNAKSFGGSSGDAFGIVKPELSSPMLVPLQNNATIYFNNNIEWHAKALADLEQKRVVDDPNRTEVLTLDCEELDGYRKVIALEDIQKLDKRFFEKHKNAKAFTRPLCRFEFLPDVPILNAGNVTVYFVSDNMRKRVLRGDLECS